eukprot:6077367-Prymnesium_polylepis.1
MMGIALVNETHMSDIETSRSRSCRVASTRSCSCERRSSTATTPWRRRQLWTPSGPTWRASSRPSSRSPARPIPRECAGRPRDALGRR